MLINITTKYNIGDEFEVEFESSKYSIEIVNINVYLRRVEKSFWEISYVILSESRGIITYTEEQLDTYLKVNNYIKKGVWFMKFKDDNFISNINKVWVATEGIKDIFTVNKAFEYYQDHMKTRVKVCSFNKFLNEIRKGW